MIRKGEYGVFSGKKFELFYYNQSYYLRSRDQQDTEIGFSSVEGRDSLYIKKVDKSDLEDAYEIVPYAFYKGYKFGIAGFSNERKTVSIVTNDPKVRDLLKLEAPGVAEFTKDVPIHELDVKEEKRPIMGFSDK
ncbi:hypothetical protein [Pseudalkalibacillus decolorationis]|uniref:hypothetical protein n=1 Tax=Pseudalkalibacillus decolorationis TaxID=163879 RepID=UPI002147E7BC|nr:hypothetical protein [Pseudalkalibacillus decolorationis]